MADINNHPLNRRHNLDSAMTTIWEFYKKLFLPLFSISFISALIVSFLSSGIDLSELQTMDDPAMMMELLRPFAGRYIMIILVSIFFSMILQYYIIMKPVDHEGNTGEWITKVLIRFLFPLLAVYIILSILSIFAMILGVIALIIGIFFALLYVMIFFTFAAPVMMVEETSIPETLRRVFTLGHKKFGTNLGWVAIFILLMLIISIILSAIIMLPFTGGFIRAIINPETAGDIVEVARRPSYIILASLTSALTMPLYPIFALLLYFNARSYESDNATIRYTGQDNGTGVTVEDLYARPDYEDDGSDDDHDE